MMKNGDKGARKILAYKFIVCVFVSILLCACSDSNNIPTPEVDVANGSYAWSESGSNLLSAEEVIEPGLAEEPVREFRDSDFDLVFYWQASASKGSQKLEISPSGTQEWISLYCIGDEMADIWAGSCSHGEHGWQTVTKYCINFERETLGTYDIRCVSDERFIEPEDRVLYWQVNEIPISGTNTLLNCQSTEPYGSWENGRTVIFVDKLELCNICPQSWKRESKN